MNSSLLIGLLVVILIILLIVFWLFGIYNKLLKLRVRCDNAWAQIDVQLQRRFDLIPNLVGSVKGYMAHEKDTLEGVTLARAAISNARTTAQKMEAENQLTEAIGRLFAVAEAYPDLKADKLFIDLQAQTKDTEDKVSYMRQSYNDCVMNYNFAIQAVPAVFFAGIMGFHTFESFDAVLDADKAPVIDFSNPASPTQG